MPKVNDNYEPKWQSARVRAREAEYIRKVAEQYDEKFIDALYRIVNFHRDYHLGHPPVIPISAKTPIVKSTSNVETNIDNADIELDTDMFE
jgi:hypothetical protein